MVNAEGELVQRERFEHGLETADGGERDEGKNGAHDEKRNQEKVHRVYVWSELRALKHSPGPGTMERGRGAGRILSWNAEEKAWEGDVADYYLLKTEPSEYSFADLVKDGETEWDGVSNPTAVKNLREMKPGARLIIYETGDMKSAVGTATVVSVSAKDPKKPVVKIKAGKALAKAVTLGEIKQNKLFGESPLVRIGRLSVVPLTGEQYKALAGG